MLEERKVFHESWYRIAGQRIALRSSVKVRRQMYRGSRWYVLHDPFNNQFYRLPPPAYAFVARLGLERTLEEVWQESVAQDAENAPGQEEVIHLLAQLYHANLLHYELPADSEKLFERYRERRQRTRQATLLNIMFIRLPLFDPDRLLQRLQPLARLLFSPLGLLAWSAVLAGALKVAIENFPALRMQSQGILALPNLALMYLALVLIKALHELGHALAVRRFGGEVHTLGVMFLIFSPLPYMDATAAWAFRSKWRRVLVGAAGMIAELFAAAVAVFVWAGTGPGILHSLAYNTIFVASLSTILFNINPLLRFDGYYILSDLLDIPNLHAQSSRELRHLVERFAFGVRQSRSPAGSRSEAFWLSVFGALSGAYKLVVFSTILLVVADRFLLAGVIMAAVCAVAWVPAPLVRLARYLAGSPRLEHVRLRAAGVCLGALALVFGLLCFLPFPSGFKAPGILEAAEHIVVANGVPGYIDRILASPGSRVEKGDALLSLRNGELAFRIQEVQASLRQVQATRQKALLSSRADLRSIDSLESTFLQQLNRLRQDEQRLVLRAEIGGRWSAPQLRDFQGMWIRRGTPLGQLLDDRAFVFTSVVSQQEVSRVFSDAIRSSKVRLAGQAGVDLEVLSMTRVQAELTRLPSISLGFAGGGEVAVDVRESSGAIAAESFYEVRMEVAGGAALYHGRSGRVRFRLEPEPLLRQGYRRLRQLLQRRYQL